MEHQKEVFLNPELHELQSKSRIQRESKNIQICHVVIGKDIDRISLMALLRKQIAQGVILHDQPIVVSEPIYCRMMELLKQSEFRHIGEPAPIEPERYIERKQKRGTFDRTGESPGATLDKKRKWWKR